MAFTFYFNPMLHKVTLLPHTILLLTRVVNSKINSLLF